MVNVCCVDGCKQEIHPASGLSMHRFPTNEKLKRRWLEVVRGKITKSSVVCSLHFKAEDFIPTGCIKKKLKPDTVPSIFPYDRDQWRKLVSEAKTHSGSVSQQSEEDCTNDSSNVTKADGIIFHVFPKNKYFRTAWLEALGLNDWEPNERSVVCSEHFSSDASSSTPRKNVLMSDSAGNARIALNDAAVLKACRICLAMDTKLYGIRDTNLYQAYVHLLGGSIGEEDKLPQRVCWECAQRLHNSSRFKAKAERSQELMMEVLLTNPYHEDKIASFPIALGNLGKPASIFGIITTYHQLSVRNVKSIKNSNPELASTLTTKHFKPSSYGKQVNESKLSVKVKVEKIDEFNANSDDDDDFDDSVPLAHISNDDRELTVKNVTDVINEDTDEEMPHMPIVEVAVKDEKDDDIFLDENVVENNFDDSDDDVKVKKRVAKKVKKERKPRAKKTQKKTSVKAKKAKVVKDAKPTSAVAPRKSEREKRTPEEPLDESLFTISKLSFDDQIAEVEKRQETSAYIDAPFKCTICYRGYYAKDRYDIHMVKHSEIIGALQCFICKFRMKSARALRKHIYAQHTYNFKCNKCPYVTKTRSIAREHQKWHTGALYQCPRCPRNFGKYTSYMGHIRIKHASDFVCELCGFTFVSEKGIDVHKKTKHRLHDKNTPLEGPFCDVCNVRFISDEAHTRHLKVSSKHISDDDPNRLHNDSVSMKIERTRRRPGEAAASEMVTHTCEDCDIPLHGLRAYNQHLKKYHPDKHKASYPPSNKPFMCEQCGKIFSHINYLTAHMYAHTGEKAFKCDECEKSFAHKITLTIHKRTHSDTPPSYECPICGRHFSEPNNRRRHMRIHTGEKPYKCEYCEKCFTSSSEKRAHVDHVHLKKPWPKRARTGRQTWRNVCPSETDDMK